MEDLLARVRALPSVESTAFIDDLFIASQGHASVTFPGRDATTMTAGELTEGAVSAEFFSTMRVPLGAGDICSRTMRSRRFGRCGPRCSIELCRSPNVRSERSPSRQW